MSQTLQQIRELVARREIQISDHGYDERNRTPGVRATEQRVAGE